MLKKILMVLGVLAVIAVGGIGYLYYTVSKGPDMAKAQAMERKPAPIITLATFPDKNQVSLQDLIGQGKPVYLNFWATWCPPCVGEMPHFEALYPKYQNQIQFLAVSQDAKKEAADSFIADKGYTFPVAWDADQKAGQTYGVQAIPTSVLIDAEGKIIDIHVGGMSAGQLEDFLKQAVK